MRAELLPNCPRVSQNKLQRNSLVGQWMFANGWWCCIILREHFRVRVLCHACGCSGVRDRVLVLGVKCFIELILSWCSKWTWHSQTLEEYWTSFEEGNADCLSPGNIQVICGGALVVLLFLTSFLSEYFLSQLCFITSGVFF